MAIDLKAIFSVQDNGSKKLRDIMKQTNALDSATKRLTKSSNLFRDSNGRLRDSMGHFAKDGGRYTAPLKNFGSALRETASAGVSVVRALNPVGLALGGIAASAGTAYGAMKLFNATVGEAMKFEQSEVTIKAMFDNQKASSEYIKMVEKMALDSPLFDSQAMFDSSKSFISLTKDNKQLKEMWKLTELLMASNPMQGVEGAVYALREFFNGQTESIKDRFELSSSDLNAIKDIPLDKQISGMNELLKKMGFTQNLISDMGNTAMGKVTQVKERMQLLLRDIGMPSVNVVANFMDDILKRFESQDVTKFANWGAKIMTSIVSGVRNSSIALYDYISSLVKSPEFQSITTITGKIKFVIEDLADKFQAWWNGGGEAKIVAFGSSVAQVLVAALDASGAAASIGSSMGSALWQGVLSGVKASASASPIGQVLSPLLQGASKAADWLFTSNKEVKKMATDAQSGANKRGKGGRNSHYHGIDSVPRDGYQATLHKGERVMTRQENQEDKKGNGAKGIAINISGVTINNGVDINAFATQLANEIERKVSVGV